MLESNTTCTLAEREGVKIYIYIYLYFASCLSRDIEQGAALCSHEGEAPRFFLLHENAAQQGHQSCPISPYAGWLCERET